MAEHQHEWRDHCEAKLCPWRSCSCGSTQDTTGHTPGRIIPRLAPPQEPK